MAKKSVNVIEAKAVHGEFKNVTEVNVLRVPRVDKTGVWMKSAKGNLHFDTLCYPVSTRLEYISRSKTDPKVFSFNIGGNVVDIAGAKLLAIGVGCITDTTTKTSYMVYNKDQTDAIPADVKHTVLNRCKRISTLKRMNVVCKLIESISKTQGIQGVFNEQERSELFNTPAKLLNNMKDVLARPVGTRTARNSYFALA